LDGGGADSPGFLGEFFNRIDAKGRVSVPAKFLRVIEAGDPEWQQGGNPGFVLVWGMFRQHRRLSAYTVREMNRTVRRITAMKHGPERAALQAMMTRGSVNVAVDANGRMVMPPNARELLGDGEELVFAGAGDHFQIWTPDAYAADVAATQDWFGTQTAYADPMEMLNLAPEIG
jgi:MraZ protein